eukprot:3713009-Pyramimonas_sp.AAC.1
MHVFPRECDQFCLFGVLSGPSRAVFGASWTVLEPPFEVLGASWRPWTVLGFPGGFPGAPLGSLFGPSWNPLGALSSRLWALLDRL